MLLGSFFSHATEIKKNVLYHQAAFSTKNTMKMANIVNVFFCRCFLYLNIILVHIRNIAVYINIYLWINDIS